MNLIIFSNIHKELLIVTILYKLKVRAWFWIVFIMHHKLDSHQNKIKLFCENDCEVNFEQDQYIQVNKSQSILTNNKLLIKLKENWLVLFIWLLALILRLLSAIFSKGFIHPDEIFQSIEVIYKSIFGIGYIPWEFVDGARSWVYPWLVYIIFKIMIFFGATDIEVILIGVRLFSGLISMITVVTAYYFGKELYGKKAGIFATFFVAIWYDFIFWSTRTMTDGIAVNFLFLAIYFVFRIKKSQTWKNKLKESDTQKEILFSSLCGFFIGIAYIFKFPLIIFSIPIIIWLIFYKRWRGIVCFLFSLISVFLLHGLIDYYTWGTFLQSTIEFLKYNIILGKNAQHGAYPFFSYIAFFAYYYSIFSILFLLFIGLGIKKNWKTIFLICSSMFFIIIFSFIAHKEYRFILPIMPLLSLIAANGMTNYPKFIKMKKYQNFVYGFIVLIICLCSTLIGLFDMTFRPNYHYCQAVKFAGAQADVEAVIVIGEYEFNSPGYSYLQKDINFDFIKWRYTHYTADYVYPGKVLYLIVLDETLEKHPSIYDDLALINATLIQEFIGIRNYLESSVYLYKRA
ncbi:MAG: hypothetical protein EAX90_13630 [Candidatus Heimdallarchaeota archaeon]|nr:hypothetical protein [Candidatus Heimdallarchaeota archaeon]